MGDNSKIDNSPRGRARRLMEQRNAQGLSREEEIALIANRWEWDIRSPEEREARCDLILVREKARAAVKNHTKRINAARCPF